MSTKTSFKRIALVAVAALGMGVLTSIAPANAAAVTASVTGTVSPIRVTYSGTTRDAVPAGTLTFTLPATLNASKLTDATTSVVTTVTVAPSGLAEVTIDDIGGTTASSTASIAGGTGTLAGGGLAGDLAAGTEYTAKISLNDTATAGTYAGKSVFTDTTGDGNIITVNWTFTTTGAAKSFTVTPAATSVLVGGRTDVTIDVKDAAGNLTQITTSDSFALSDSSGTYEQVAAGGDQSITAADISEGTIDVVFTGSGTAGSSTLTTTPQGTLPSGGMTASTVTITESGTIFATQDTNIVFTVSTPADAATATGTVNGDNRAQSVRAGTSAITVAVTNAAVSETLRFGITASAGTVDGTAYTTTVYKNISTNALGTGAVSFTLGGAALLNGATITVEQVDVVNADIATGTGGATDIVITQSNAVFNDTNTLASPAGSIVRKLGDSTTVTVTILDQFKGNLGAGWTVRAYRGTVTAGNLLDTKVTDATGAAKVVVAGKSTLVTGNSETYVYTYQAVGGAESAAITSSTTITYTTTGTVTSLSVAIAGSNGDLATALGSADATISDTEIHASTLAIPVVYVPTAGTVAQGTAQTAKATTAGVITAGGGAASNVIALTHTAVDANSAVYTTDAGAFVASSLTGLTWNTGKTTLEIGNSTAVYVFATKTGLHTVTVTSGGKTVSLRFWAANVSTDYYSVSAAAESLTPAAGSTSVVTVTVKDIFGNVVDADDDVLTVTASGKVRLAGQALSSVIKTTAAGTYAFSLLADAAGGAGELAIGLTTTGAQAWASTYVKPTGVTADPVKSATLKFTVGGTSSGGTLASLTTLVNKLITKINAMQSLLNKIQKKLGVK